MVSRISPVLVILGLELPDLDGLAICKQFRTDQENQFLGIILISVKGAEDDLVLGLESGADDYLFKPFSPRELAARAKAVHRRCGFGLG